MRNRISKVLKAEITDIKELLSEGYTVTEISKAYNRTMRNISAIKHLKVYKKIGGNFNSKLRAINKERKKNKHLSKEEIKKVITFLMLDLEQIFIAKHFDVSKSSITYIKNKHFKNHGK